jgi:hypothetical protein
MDATELPDNAKLTAKLSLKVYGFKYLPSGGGGGRIPSGLPARLCGVGSCVLWRPGNVAPTCEDRRLRQGTARLHPGARGNAARDPHTASPTANATSRGAGFRRGRLPLGKGSASRGPRKVRR